METIFPEQKVKSIVDIFNKNKHINFIQDNPTYYFPKTKKMKLNKLKTKFFLIILGLISIQQVLWFLKENF